MSEKKIGRGGSPETLLRPPDVTVQLGITDPTIKPWIHRLKLRGRQNARRPLPSLPGGHR